MCSFQPQYSALLTHRLWHMKGGRNESWTSYFFGWGRIPCRALTEVVCHVREVLPVAGRGLRCCTGLNISRRCTATSSIASALQWICVVCSVTYTYDIDSTYRCAGVHLYRHASVQLYRCADVRVCRFTGVKLYSCTGVKVWRCTVVKVWKCEILQFYRCESVQMYSCTGVQMYRCEIVKVYSFTGVQGYRCAGVSGLFAVADRTQNTHSARISRCAVATTAGLCAGVSVRLSSTARTPTTALFLCI